MLHPQRGSSAPVQLAPKFGRRWLLARGRRISDLFGCTSPSSGELSLERCRFSPWNERPEERRGEERSRTKTVEELAEEESRKISNRILSSMPANNTAVGRQPQHRAKKPPTVAALSATTASPQRISSGGASRRARGIVTHSERVYDAHRSLQIRKRNVANRHGNRVPCTYRALSPVTDSDAAEPRGIAARGPQWAQIAAAVADGLSGGGGPNPSRGRIREGGNGKNKKKKPGIPADVSAATLKRFSDLIRKRDRKGLRENATDTCRQWFDSTHATGRGKDAEGLSAGLGSDSWESMREALTTAAGQSSTASSRARGEPSPKRQPAGLGFCSGARPVASRASPRTCSRDFPDLCEIGNRRSYMYLQPTRQPVLAESQTSLNLEGGSGNLLPRASSSYSSMNRRRFLNMMTIEEARVDDGSDEEEYPPSDSFALFRTDHLLLHRPFGVRGLEPSPTAATKMQTFATPQTKHHSSPPASLVGSEGESTPRAKRRSAPLILRPEPPGTTRARHRSEPATPARGKTENNPAPLVYDWQQAARSAKHAHHHHHHHHHQPGHPGPGLRCGCGPEAARSGSEPAEEDIPEPVTVRYSPIRAPQLHDRWRGCSQGSSRNSSTESGGGG